jgi:hypothetical protein
MLLALTTLAGALLLLCGPSFRAKPQAPAADLDARLKQRVTFIPQSKPLPAQLVEVAQHYQLPMGIEVPAMSSAAPIPQVGAAATVQDLLRAIILQAPDLQLTADNNIIHIAPPTAATDPRNVLNLRLDKYCVTDQNLFQAEQALRLKIELELHPGDYAEGFVSSYGYPHGHVFTLKKLTLCRANLTVREALDELAAANGNALWLVEHNAPAVEPAKQPVAPQPESNQELAPKPWRFLPLQGAVSN